MTNDDTPGALNEEPVADQLNRFRRELAVQYAAEVETLKAHLQQAETERVRMQCERDSALNDRRSLMADYRVVLAERDRLKAAHEEFARRFCEALSKMGVHESVYNTACSIATSLRAQKEQQDG